MTVTRIVNFAELPSVTTIVIVFAPWLNEIGEDAVPDDTATLSMTTCSDPATVGVKEIVLIALETCSE